MEGINQLIWNMGEKFREEVVRPVGPTPSQFPVNQSFTLAATHSFFTLPNAVQKRLKRTSPETLAQRGKRLGTKISPLSIWMLGYAFLVGREILLDLGAVEEEAHADDIAQVLTCWQQLAFAHRGDGHLDNSDAGFTNRFLPSATVEHLYRSLIPVDPEMKRRVREFLPALEAYLFLLNAEAHLGTVDSGPYPLNSERLLIVRDFFDLKGRWYPWRETVADLPYYTCSLAFTLDPKDFRSLEVSDRAALLTSPPDYTALIRDIAFMSHDDRPLRILPFTEMDWLTRMVKKVQPRILAWFRRLSRRDWVIFGALPWALRPFSLIANDEECFFWEPAPEALRLLPMYEDDDAQAVRWATHRCLVPGRSHAFTALVDRPGS